MSAVEKSIARARRKRGTDTINGMFHNPRGLLPRPRRQPLVQADLFKDLDVPVEGRRLVFTPDLRSGT